MNDLHSSAVFRAYGSERRKVRLGGTPLLKCDIISSPLRNLLFFSRFYSFCRSLSSAPGRLRPASFICVASFLLLPFSGIYIPQQRAITFCLSGEKVTVVWPMLKEQFQVVSYFLFTFRITYERPLDLFSLASHTLCRCCGLVHETLFSIFCNPVSAI